MHYASRRCQGATVLITTGVAGSPVRSSVRVGIDIQCSCEPFLVCLNVHAASVASQVSWYHFGMSLVFGHTLELNMGMQESGLTEWRLSKTTVTLALVLDIPCFVQKEQNDAFFN